MSNSTAAKKPSVNDLLVEVMRRLGPDLRGIDYVKDYIASGRPKPSGKAICRAKKEAFGSSPKRKYVRRSKAVTSTTPAVQDDLALAFSDKVNYDMIQVKETAALVGGLDRMIALATRLKNWQL